MASLARNAKEAWRHLIFRLSGGASTRWSKKWRHKAHLEEPKVADRFSKIYASGYWSRGREGVPGSGDGSTLDATAPLRARLPGLIEEQGIASFLDVGCGDFTWMREVVLGCPYVGVDIVAAVVEANERAFADAAHRFAVRNAITDELPDGEAVLCRDMLFHLSLADGLSALRNILSKDRRLLIVTTDAVTDVNGDIITGDYRARNLRRPPFNLPEPIEVIDDSIVEPMRTIGVWRAEDVRRALSI